MPARGARAPTTGGAARSGDAKRLRGAGARTRGRAGCERPWCERPAWADASRIRASRGTDIESSNT
nr:MAG TPA: hypothetical protein [Caudoviricetes sp.]